MEVFRDYLAQIENPEHRDRVEEILGWVMDKFPQLVPRIAWSQPMFTDHGTFIIGFSTAKHHLAVAPEYAATSRFSEEIIKTGYDHTQELVRIKWDLPVNFSLLEKIINFNIMDKKECSTFWRKQKK
ncbi:MAG: iron chaperone [Clostridiaceae bacterium]